MHKNPLNPFLILLFLLFAACSDDLVKNEEPKPDEPDIPELPVEYKPGNASDIDADVKVVVKSAIASEHQPGSEIGKSIDGDFGTLYHSRWGDQTKYPVVLEYTFDEKEEGIDYVLLHPRKDGNNGRILNCEVFVKSRGDDAFRKLGDYEFNGSDVPKIIRFNTGFSKPEAFRISVSKGVNDFVSLAEIEFYKKSTSLTQSLSLFSDKACTSLKTGTTLEQINAVGNAFVKNMARALYQGVYDSMRIGTYSSYPDPDIIARSNKTGTYGLYDNVTGIHIRWGDDMVVFVDDFVGDMSLRVVNHSKGFGGEDFILQPGVNRFKVRTEGLAYIIYQDDEKYQVKINFATGAINGYFDASKHSNKDWETLIGNASYSFFDLLGQYSHLTFTTDDLKRYTKNPERLLQVYDSIVSLEQDFMGLVKYNRTYPTCSYFRTNTHQDMYMYSTSNRTEYTKSTMPELCDFAKVRSSPWGPAHEVGHTHQTRPGLKWLGTTEVTTNIYSLWVQTTFGNCARIDEEYVDGYNNRYEKAFTELVAPGLAHAAHQDVFCKLVPFWQLQLYFANVKGQTDFYKDVHERIRINNNPTSDGEAQLQFVKTCCEVAQTDLTDFFTAWGFLSPVNLQIDDYGNANMVITQSMVDEVKNDILAKSYPKPDASLEYIHDQCVGIFKSKAAVVYGGSATVAGNQITVSNCANAVAYVQLRNNKPIFIATRPSFKVHSFEANDKLAAISFDGRQTVISIQ
ncbi:MAG: M60 family metallopeptidase [Breznakibacter sp.]